MQSIGIDAQVDEAVRILPGLRRDHVELCECPGNQANPLVLPVGLFRHARVDDADRDARIMHGRNEIRPKFRLDENDQARIDCFEEAPHDKREIGGKIDNLVFGEYFLRDRVAGYRERGYHDSVVPRQTLDRLDECPQQVDFTGRRAVQPDGPAFRIRLEAGPETRPQAGAERGPRQQHEQYPRQS